MAGRQVDPTGVPPCNEGGVWEGRKAPLLSLFGVLFFIRSFKVLLSFLVAVCPLTFLWSFSRGTSRQDVSLHTPPPPPPLSVPSPSDVVPSFPAAFELLTRGAPRQTDF